jgi:glutamyl-Q tRNA(Asp) synthetase
MHTPEAHGLAWDGDVMFQSKRLTIYDDVLQQLRSRDLTYFCQCTRKQIKAKGEYYTGTCANLDLQGEDLALRLRNPKASLELYDQFQGKVSVPTEILYEDFVLKRRDGLHGYHLVSVVDDIEQAITQVVRGADLLFPSACQMVLYGLLDAQQPTFLHVPVAVSSPGKKLSKQNHSPPLNNSEAPSNLISVLDYLGMVNTQEMQGASPEDILEQAICHWHWQGMQRSTEHIVAPKWC